MKRYTIILFVFWQFQIQAQSLKTKRIEVPMPDYAEQLAPKNGSSYWAEVTLGADEVLNFTNEEFKKELQLEDFEQITDDQAPDIFFAINGISVDDLHVTGTIAPVLGDTYSVNIVTKEDTGVKLLFFYKEELTQLWQIPVQSETDVRGTQIPVTINFSADEKEKYLDMESSTAVPDISSYTVEKYLDKIMGEYFLQKITRTIQEIYDNNVAKEYINFYYIKDKKNKALSKESKERLTTLVELCKSYFTSLKDIRTNKQQMDAQISYWGDLLPIYGDSDKSNRKTRWGILMNLHNLSLMVEDFDNAKGYLDQATDLDVKSTVVKRAQANFSKSYSDYLVNYDEETGERKYSKGYEKNPMINILKLL